MLVKILQKPDLLYYRKGKAVDSEEKEEGVRLEYDRNRNLIGIEIANMTQKLAKPIAEKLSLITR